jgi:hypothetical protein
MGVGRALAGARAPGGGSGASAKVSVNASGSITGIAITSAGVGYTSAPNVTIFDAPGRAQAGTGATAIATVNAATGMITSITVTSQGSGYSVPTICEGPVHSPGKPMYRSIYGSGLRKGEGRVKTKSSFSDTEVVF